MAVAANAAPARDKNRRRAGFTAVPPINILTVDRRASCRLNGCSIADRRLMFVSSVVVKGEFPISFYPPKDWPMTQKIDWESQIGRRLKLRDLHVFSTVVQRGSMAKAAQQLGVSQPAVSEVIANLEHALGVRLLDRSAQGIEPTIYGGALIKRSVAAFDELKQSIRDIEFLSDATVGEVRMACMESLWHTLVPEAIL